MLAVFGKTRGVNAKHGEADMPRHVMDEEDEVYEQFEALIETVPRRMRGYVAELFFGQGANGLAYVEEPLHTFASTDDGVVSVFARGHIDGTAQGAGEKDAAYILRKYNDDWRDIDPGESWDPSVELAMLKGKFIFILFDSERGKIIAARDVQGGEEMYWGTSIMGTGLKFSTDKKLLERDCADVDLFPGGAVFISEPGEISGNTFSLSVPEVDGQTAEIMCRPASQADLAATPHSEISEAPSAVPKVPSRSEIAAS